MQPNIEPTASRLAYSIDQFCDACGIARTAAYREIAEGRLRTFKAGRRRLVSEEAARDWIAAREREAA